jgi:hypothetical protein
MMIKTSPSFSENFFGPCDQELIVKSATEPQNKISDIE